MTTIQPLTLFAPAEPALPTQTVEQPACFENMPLLSRMFDAVPDAFVVLNDKRQVVFANRALAELGGLQSPRAAHGLRTGELLQCVHAIESEGGCGTTEFCQTCGAVQAILAGLHGKAAVKECRITQRTGDALDLRVWATPLSLEGETFVLFAVKDIGDEKRRRVLERIFFHDLLNTAGSIRGFAELLRDATLEELTQIKRSVYVLADRLIDEINAQREITDAENDELTVEPVPIESVALLTEIVTLYAFHEVASGRRILISPRAQSVRFTNDKVLLSRVLGNMVKNALEASGVGAQVTLDCQLRQDCVEFTVHNPSCMPRRVQLQMFQRSFSTKGSNRGLGTYSMKLLSERYLGGHVDFTSSPEQGTTFVARYPLDLPAG